MDASPRVPSTIGATYVEPSAEEVLQPGLKLGDLYARNMSQPYVLQRLAELEAVGFLRLTLAVNENVS